jgi:cation transport regulator ChaB
LLNNLLVDFISGWTWYCEKHDSFGHASTEHEIKLQANSHLAFFSKLNCHVFIKNHDQTPTLLKSNISRQTPKSNYMEKIKESFARAYQKWSLEEDEELKINFNNRMSLGDLAGHHKRAEGGIVARLRKLGLVDQESPINEIRKLLDNKHSKLINAKAFTSELKTYSSVDKARYERGRDSFEEFGTVNPPPIELPDLSHTSLFSCSICSQPVIGNSCLCRNQL